MVIHQQFSDRGVRAAPAAIASGAFPTIEVMPAARDTIRLAAAHAATGR